MKVNIPESGVVFGPFDAENIYKFRKDMGADLRLWNIAAHNVRVLNEEKARLYGLVA